jgi:hypothetical protein
VQLHLPEYNPNLVFRNLDIPLTVGFDDSKCSIFDRVNCAVSQFELISVQEWDSRRFRTYLQELVLVWKSGTSTDILLCFDVHGLEVHRATAEEGGIQSHVCLMLDVISTDGDDDWGVRLVDPAPTRRRVWTCRGESLMSAMQVSIALHDPKPLKEPFSALRAGSARGDDAARAAQDPPAEACCGIWVLRANGQA